MSILPGARGHGTAGMYPDRRAAKSAVLWVLGNMLAE